MKTQVCKCTCDRCGFVQYVDQVDCPSAQVNFVRIGVAHEHDVAQDEWPFVDFDLCSGCFSQVHDYLLKTKEEL